jgi:D-alanine-D-alanine ligase
MKKKIAVIRGGPSSENEVSMKTGRTVIDELGKDHDVLDIVIDKQGVWICQGREVKPDVICRTCDLVFNALHGEYGEDGQVQRILEQTGVPFTGPRKMAAALSMNKAQTKEIYKQFGIKTPLYKIVNRKDGDVNKIAIEIFRGFTMPVIIKPVSLGSSVGISIARDYKTLLDTLISLFIRFDQLLVEEYIQGKEATVAVVENFRGKYIYSFLPVEIRIPNTCQFFDYEAKYSGKTEEICPGSFSLEESKAMQDFAAKAHEALGLRHYSRTDFIINSRRGIYAIETNSLPGLTKESLLPKSLQPVGSNYKEFIDHVVWLALKK